MYVTRLVNGIPYKVWETIEFNCDQDADGHCSCDSEKQDVQDDSLQTANKTIVGAINEVEQEVTAMADSAQNREDNNLNTTDKTIVGAINEVNTKAVSHEELGVVRDIAQGRKRAYVFDTVEQLDAALLDPEFVSTLTVGDDFLIRALEVPDYWWDGAIKQILETQKVQFDLITNAEIDNLF